MTDQPPDLWERVAAAIYDVDEERGNGDRPRWEHLSTERKAPWLKDAERAIAIWSGCRPNHHLTGAYAREALARALRSRRHGDIRPMWQDAPEPLREEWRRQADFVIGRLKASNCFIIVPDDRLAELVAAVKELMVFEMRDYMKESERAKTLTTAKRRCRAALSAFEARP